MMKIRPFLKREFGGPILGRYAGCPSVERSIYSNKSRKVLEYLWDFSFSRHAIPEAIEMTRPLESGKYELLFVAESELGTSNEICRDLLKLADARAKIRCLIHRQPKRVTQQEILQKRIIRVLNNHAYFDPRYETWLFIAITWDPQSIDCQLYTLNEYGTQIIPIGGCKS